MKERILRRILNTDIVGFGLIMIAIYLLLYGVEAAMRGTQTRNLFWFCLLAAMISFCGARSKLNGKQMSAVILALGGIGVWILGARITGPVLKLIRSILAAGPQLLPEITYRFDIDGRDITSSWEAISLASSALMARWQTWLLAAIENFQVNDVLIRNMLWTLVLWLLSAWIGWFAAKRNGMASLLPGVLLLTLLIGSSERRLESLWAFVMIMLLLMGIWNYKNHVQHWESNHFDYSDSIRFDVGQYLLVIIVVVGLISYITPSISWQDIRDYFREREGPNQAETVTHPSNNSNAGPQVVRAPGSSLPREHLLTAGYAQSKDIVMTIKTGELSPVPIQSPTLHVPRYYWRSVVYDQYDGRGWFTTAAPSQSIAANHPMIAGVLSDYKLLHLNIQMQQPEGKLHWSGMLYSADVPLSVDWRLRPQSSLFADQTTLLQADMFAARTDASAYRADTFVPIPSIEQLRAAPVDEYPAHIRNRYFSLPATIPQRVHRLAREITEGQMTAYDKAKAIETYLRTNYPYDLEIPAPPEDQDVADYFLFDLTRGYCDYYATAMVVLARSSGIPARFVSGYASGDYDMANAEYVVRELHAHSWVEVYFPEIGWIEFEPTGNQPEIERQVSNLQSSGTDESKSITPSFYLELTTWRIGALLIPLAIVLFALMIYFAVFEPFFFSRMAPVAAIEILYQRLYRSARTLAGERTRAETAYEFTNKLIQNIQLIDSAFNRSQHMLEDVNNLATIYQAALFSNRDIGYHDVKHALNIWNRLRWSLVIERIKRFMWMRNRSSP